MTAGLRDLSDTVCAKHLVNRGRGCLEPLQSGASRENNLGICPAHAPTPRPPARFSGPLPGHTHRPPDPPGTVTPHSPHRTDPPPRHCQLCRWLVTCSPASVPAGGPAFRGGRAGGIAEQVVLFDGSGSVGAVSDGRKSPAGCDGQAMCPSWACASQESDATKIIPEIQKKYTRLQVCPAVPPVVAHPVGRPLCPSVPSVALMLLSVPNADTEELVGL